MTKTTLLVATIIVVLAITLTTGTVAMGQAAPENRHDPNCIRDSYRHLQNASAVQQGNSALKLSVDTCGNIPRFADSFINGQIVFGYAWLDTSSRILTGVVAAIHPTFDDSNQNPHAWHTHAVSLSPGGNSDFCIAGLGTSQGGLSLHGDVMQLNMAENQSDISADNIDLAASFVVVRDETCAGTGLGVDVLSSVPVQ